MSELSELIKINKNIERQNEEIIRLLKRIAGEKEIEKEIPSPFIMPEEIEEPEAEKMPDIKPAKDESEMLLNKPHEVGEVCFIENRKIFKVVRKDNKTMVNNLSSIAYPMDFRLQELVAIESVNRNMSLDDATVILSKSQSMSLPETLKICFDEGAKNVFIPMSASTLLLGAPETLMSVLNIDFYKSDDHLIEKLFE